ncbi:MAG: hypothetical protein ACHQQ3_11855 [Gemmatimonadales bacterium]
MTPLDSSTADAPPSGRARGDAAVPFVLLAIGSLILSIPAFWNGFPLVFYDSSSYIADAIQGHAFWARSPVYSVFILMLHRRLSLWPVVLVQGALVTYLLYLTTRVVLGRVAPLRFTMLLVLLAALTSLPWHSGQIMADIFTPMVILGCFLLGVAQDRLSFGEWMAVVGITGLAIAVHHSGWPLAAGLVLVALFLQRRVPGAWNPKRIAVRVAPLFLAWALYAGASAFDGGRWSVGHLAMTVPDVVQPWTRIAPYGDIFLLARLLEDGPARDYLRATCPAAGFLLCPYLDAIPPTGDGFLWSPTSPLWTVGGVEPLRGEAHVITAAAVRAEPLRVLTCAVRNSVLQLARFRTGDSLHPYLETDDDGGQWVPIVLRRYFPEAYPQFLAARQATGRIDLRWIRRLDAAVAALGAVGLLLLARRFRTTGDRIGFALAVVLLAGIVVNGVASGSFSAPHDRYQSRVIWLAVFGALVGAVRAPDKRSDQA